MTRSRRYAGPVLLLLATGCTTAGGDTVVITPFGWYAQHTQVSKTDPGTALTALQVAAAIATRLNAVADQCKRIGRPEYQVDCLGEGYARAAQTIPEDQTFSDARAAVMRASGALSQLAAANRAAGAPDLATKDRSRPIHAVAPAKLAQVRAQAVKIIEETQTVLLRSQETTPDRKEAYQQIAQAVDSAKVLLRSA